MSLIGKRSTYSDEEGKVSNHFSVIIIKSTIFIRDECRILSHFSVIEMEDWLEQTHGHTETNLAECQARTAAIAASCQVRV